MYTQFFELVQVSIGMKDTLQSMDWLLFYKMSIKQTMKDTLQVYNIYEVSILKLLSDFLIHYECNGLVELFLFRNNTLHKF